MLELRSNSLRHRSFFLGAAACIALLGISAELDFIADSTADYLVGPIWLTLFLVMAKEFQRLRLRSGFLNTVFLFFSICFLAEIIVRLPITRALVLWEYIKPIIDAGWVLTCLFVLHGLCSSVLRASESEKSWRAMFDAAQDSVFVKDRKGRYTHVNKSMAESFGSREMLIGATDDTLLQGNDRERAAEEDAKVLAGESVESETTMRIGDERRTFHIIKVPICDEFDQVIGLTGIARDISERKRLEAENQQRLADLSHLARIQTAGEMVAGLAHELNQPLATATNFSFTIANMLPARASDLTDEQLDAIRERVEVVSEESLRAGEIIRRLRALVNKRHSPRQRTDLNELLADTLRLFSSQWSGKSPVEFRRGDTPLIAEVDAIQIQQIFLNLLTNARDTLAELDAPEEARLFVATTQQQGYAHIVFEDNGPGFDVPPEELFKAFVSSKQEGMGLGLAICRSIAEAHRGNLVAAPAGDAGARFTLTLPLAGTAGSESSRSSRARRQPTRRPGVAHMPPHASAKHSPSE